MARKSPRLAATVKVGKHRILAMYLQYSIQLLKNLGAQKQELRKLEAAVLLAGPKGDNRGMPRAPGVSDPTPRQAALLDDETEPTFKQRAHLRLMIHTVQEAFNHLPTDEQYMLKHLYILDTKTVRGVAMDLHMTVATVTRKRNRALSKIAVAVVGEQILFPAES